MAAPSALGPAGRGEAAGAVHPVPTAPCQRLTDACREAPRYLSCLAGAAVLPVLPVSRKNQGISSGLCFPFQKKKLLILPWKKNYIIQI